MVIDDFLNYKDAFPLSHTQEADIIDYLDFFSTLSIRRYLCRFFFSFSITNDKLLELIF